MNTKYAHNSHLHMVATEPLITGRRLAKLLSIAFLMVLALLFTERKALLAANSMPESPTNNRVLLPLVMISSASCATPPCALAPVDGAVVDTLLPTFVWDAGDINAISRLYICPTEKIPCDCSDDFCFAATGPGIHSFVPGGNLPGRQVWWAVGMQYTDAQGKLIVRQSPTRSLELVGDLPLLPAPALIGPSGTITQTSVTFRWEPVSGALDYKLCRPSSRGVDCRVTQDTELTVTFPAYEQGFDWWVEARNYYGYSDHNKLYLHIQPPRPADGRQAVQ